MTSLVGRVGLRHVLDDVTVTRVGDGQARHAEILTARCAEVDVVAGVVVYASLGQHRVVLDLTLLQWRAVVGDDHQPGCAREWRTAGGTQTSARVVDGEALVAQEEGSEEGRWEGRAGQWRRWLGFAVD